MAQIQQTQDFTHLCTDSARLASECATHCIENNDDGRLTHCIKLCLDHANVAHATATLTARETEHARHITQACAESARRCAEACQEHADEHESLRRCAEACQRCAEACEGVVQRQGA